jgi:hypothetical protein
VVSGKLHGAEPAGAPADSGPNGYRG